MSKDNDDRKKAVGSVGVDTSVGARAPDDTSSDGEINEGSEHALADGGQQSKAKAVPVKSRGSNAKVRRKKPRDMPKRPLSAYNFFFRHERERWLEESKVAAETKADGTLFSTMGKVIASRWRELPVHQMKQYQEMAQVDMERYKEEMDYYNTGMSGSKAIPLAAHLQLIAVVVLNAAEARLSRLQKGSRGNVSSRLSDSQEAEEAAGETLGPILDSRSEEKIPSTQLFPGEVIRSDGFPVESRFTYPSSTTIDNVPEAQFLTGTGLQLLEQPNMSQAFRPNEEALQYRALAAQQHFLRQELSSLYGSTSGSTYDRLAAAIPNDQSSLGLRSQSSLYGPTAGSSYNRLAAVLPNAQGSLGMESHMGLPLTASLPASLPPYNSLVSEGPVLGAVPPSLTLYSQLLSNYVGGGMGGIAPPATTLLQRATSGGSATSPSGRGAGPAGPLEPHPPFGTGQAPLPGSTSPRSLYQQGRHFGQG